MEIFKQVMEANKQVRLRIEEEEARREEAERKRRLSEYGMQMQAAYHNFISKLPALKEDLYSMVVTWILETGAEPHELEIKIPSLDQLQDSIEYTIRTQGCNWMQQAMEAALETGAILHLISKEKKLYGHINGYIWYKISTLPEKEGWEFPEFSRDFGCDDLPSKHPVEEDEGYW